MFARGAVSHAAQGSQTAWDHLWPVRDDLAETCWLLRMAQLGLGFNPDLLALAESVSAQVAADDRLPNECRQRPPHMACASRVAPGETS